MAGQTRSGLGFALAVTLAVAALTTPALADGSHEASPFGITSSPGITADDRWHTEADDEHEQGQDNEHGYSPTSTPTDSTTQTPPTTPPALPTNTPSSTPTVTASSIPSTPPAGSGNGGATGNPTPGTGDQLTTQTPTIPPTSTPAPTPSPSKSDLHSSQNDPKPTSSWPPLAPIPVTDHSSLGRAIVNGREVPAVLRPNSKRSGLDFVASGWQVSLGALTAAGATVNLSADGSLRVDRDHTLISAGEGFAPNSQVDVYIYSTPIKLGSAFTNTAGKFTADFPVPPQLEDGLHTLQVIGYSPSGDIQAGEVPVTLYSLAAAKVVRTAIIYFQSDRATVLKRTRKTLASMLGLLQSNIKAASASTTQSKLQNLQISLTAYNTRKEAHPSTNLATKRLKSLYRLVSARAGGAPITQNIGVMRRHNWAYVRLTIQYTK